LKEADVRLLGSGGGREQQLDRERERERDSLSRHLHCLLGTLQPLQAEWKGQTVGSSFIHQLTPPPPSGERPDFAIRGNLVHVTKYFDRRRRRNYIFQPHQAD